MAGVTGGLLMVMIAQFIKTITADLNIYFPDNLNKEGEYRLDYYPPYGNPSPNTTFQASKDFPAIHLSEVLPGTTYNFSLYYSNALQDKQITSSAKFTTAPNPPSWLIVNVRGGKEAIVTWNPPTKGGFTSFKLKINPYTEYTPGEVTIENITSLTYELKYLTPGASYQVKAFTVYENKESINYISQNFTTRPPSNITIQRIQTTSKDQTSIPTNAKYRTVPLRPENVTVDKNETTSNSFVVHWKPPTEKSEFDQYQVSLVTLGKSIYIPKNKVTKWEFKDNLKPGQTYLVIVKTVSGKLTSWPVSTEVTLKPLPVIHLQAMLVKRSGEITISWKTHPNSTQDNFLVSYQDVESIAGITHTVLTNQTKIGLEMLLPQINYLITVQAVSRDTQSKEESIYVVTKQSAPVTEDLKHMGQEYPIFICNNDDSILSDIRRRSISLDLPQKAESSKLTNARGSETEWYDCKILPKSYPKQHKNDTVSYMNVLTAPRFVLTSGDYIQINLGEAITISCKVEGTPTPQIIWFKDENPMISSATIGISHDGAELRISNILQEDIGDYTCLARNEGGQNLHTSKLILVGSIVYIED